MRIASSLLVAAVAGEVRRRVWTETDGTMFVELSNEGEEPVSVRPERASVRLVGVEEDLEGQQQCEGERKQMEGQGLTKTKLLIKLMGALLHQAISSDAPTLLFSYDRQEMLEWRRLRSAATERKLHEYARLTPEEKNEEGEEILRGLINDPETDMCSSVVHWLATPSFLDTTSHVHCYPHHPCHQVTKQIFISADLGFGVVNFDGNAFANRGQVVRVVRDLMCHPTLSNFELDDQVRYVGGITPNDPEFKGQWYLKDTKIDQAWTKITGEGFNYPLVMVADTGTQIDHPDMKDNLWVNEAEKNGKPGVDDDNNGYIDDVYGIRLARGSSDGNVNDDDGHGSHCAGSIAAVTNNAVGVAGASWGAKIVTCKFITGGIGYMSDAAKCIDYAVKKGVSLLSSSWGGGSELASLTTAIKNATKIGFSFASGNSGYDFRQTNKRVYPACTKLPNTLTATGSCENTSLIDYGNIGPRCVDLAAPGDYVYNLMIDSSYVYRGGTSMAAPIPIGVMALMTQINKSLSAAQLVSIVKSTTQATSGYANKVATGGRVDALAAVNAATAATKLSLGSNKSRIGKSVNLGVGETIVMPVFVEDIPPRDFRKRTIEAVIDWTEESASEGDVFQSVGANMTRYERVMRFIASLAVIAQAEARRRPLTDGRSFHWKGGELSYEFSTGEELHGLEADPLAFIHAPMDGVWQAPHPHMKINFPLSELKVLLAALQTHPPRLLFNHHPHIPKDLVSSLPWHIRNMIRDVSAMYPNTVLRGFESGNYGNFTDTQGNDIFGAHLLGEDPHMNVCDYYSPPKECLDKLDRDCLVASARRWGGSPRDIYISKHLGVGHVSLPRDPRRVTQAILEIGCNVWVSDVSTDAVMDLFDTGALTDVRAQEAHINSRGKSTNDPFFDRQWFLTDQKINEAWSTEKGQSGIKMMVVDTGVDYNHNDLKKNMWTNRHEQENQKDDDNNGYWDDIHGINPSSSYGDVMDDEGHGTHMAGVLSAVTNNGQGIAGINWGGKVISCRFIISGQPGKMSDTAKCIDYAVDQGVKVISCSFGGGASLPQLKKALETACQKGVVTVASAGNSGQNNDQQDTYPANYATELNNGCVISVGGHCKNGSMIDYGSYGANKVLVSAPGDYVYSLGPGNDYAYRGGTSPACPSIAGIIGLGFSANSNLSPEKIFNALKASVEKVPQLNGKVNWGGKINAAKFIQQVRNG